MTKNTECLRKSDFEITMQLPRLPDETDGEHEQSVGELIDSVCVVKPSFLHRRLILWVRQPLVGDVANGVIRICKYGIDACRVRTLFPNQSDLAKNVGCSHIVYDYEIGRCTEQETPMDRDVHDADGNDILVHILCLQFEKFRVDTNVMDQRNPPVLSLVQDTGSLVGSSQVK